MFLELSEYLVKVHCFGIFEQHSPMILKSSAKIVYRNKLFVVGSSVNQHLQLQINVAVILKLSFVERLVQQDQDDVRITRDLMDVQPIIQRCFRLNQPIIQRLLLQESLNKYSINKKVIIST